MQQDTEFKASEAEKNKIIEDLMGQVTRLRKQLRDERVQFRKLEDTHEEILDGRLDKDREI